MRIRALAVVGLLGGSALFTLAPAASAHEDKVVGKLDLAVGFVTEPAYAGQPNGVELFLSHDGHPITDLGDELQVTVSFGDQTSDPMTFAPAFEVGEFGIPGDYRADFVPSQLGTYTFHLTGKVHGQKVDVEFTSGPKTFDDVVDLNEATFPPVTSPSNEQLASRIENESARTTDSLGAATSAADAAASDARSARSLAIAGIAAGILGLAPHLSRFARARRSKD